MFICNKCLKKDYKNGQSLFKSLGSCEICSDVTMCNEIKSSYLIPKVTIQHAAIIRSDGELVVGKQHSDIIQHSPFGTCKVGSVQGFLTSDGVFATRQEARELAFLSGQIPKEHYDLINPNIGLISENLWSDNGFKYTKEKGYHK